MPQQKRIFVYSWPLLGHLIPVLRIAQILQQSGKNWKATLFISQSVIEQIHKLYPSIQMVGIKDQILSMGTINQMYDKIGPKQTLFNFYMKNQNWEKHFQNLPKIKPDLILADHFAVQSTASAKRHKLPLIINYPCSFEGLQYGQNFIKLKRSFRLAGLTICYPTVSPLQIHGYHKSWNESHANSLILVNSFFGFDKPQIIPPNYRLVGPIIRKQSSEKKTGEILQIQKWMQEKKKEGFQKFIYVSFGTIVQLGNQFATMLYEVLIELNCPVLWSISGPLKDKIIHKNFYARSWMPQVDILKRKEVQIFVTHCGWNSTNEAIVHEKPLVVIPCFYDQPYNADQVCQNKIGVKLISNKKLNIHQLGLNPKLKKEKVIQQFKQVLQNPMYKQNIKKLHLLSKFTKTQQIIINTAQEVMTVGTDHLINSTFEQGKNRKHWQNLVLILLIIVIVIYY